MSEQRWTPVERWTDEQPQECGVCHDRLVGRELGYGPVMCERDGCPGPTDRASVVVVPASALDEARSRVRELEDALRKIEQSPFTGGLNARRAHAALASSSAPSYAKHVGAPGVLGEGPHNSDATHTTCPACFGRCVIDVGAGDVNPPGARERIEIDCDVCAASGCVPTKEET